MPTIFSRIRAGEIPGRLVWSDDLCFAMLDIRPLHRGHTLVIPNAEVDQWTDLEPAVASHLMQVAHSIGRALTVVEPGAARVGLMIAGFEVPHTHLHVVPLESMANLDFRNAETSPRADDLDAAASELRAALRSAGHDRVVGD